MKRRNSPQRARCLDPDWKYIPAVSTNVLQRFKDMGWQPPSEKAVKTTRKGNK